MGVEKPDSSEDEEASLVLTNNQSQFENPETNYDSQEASAVFDPFEPLENESGNLNPLEDSYLQSPGMDFSEERTEDQYSVDEEETRFEQNGGMESEEFVPLEPDAEAVDLLKNEPMDEREAEYQELDLSASPNSTPIDITSFANSEESSLNNGELLYDLTISLLDSKDLKETLKMVLLDPKLKLNHHEILKSIKEGRVIIANLNPIKAKRIAEQLQYFSLNVTWKQKRVVMSEPEKKLALTSEKEESSGSGVDSEFI